MANDYYHDACSLALDLRAQAALLVEGAQRIDDAVAAGFTATEILMGIRFHVNELLVNDEIALSPKPIKAAMDLVNEIDRVLGTAE